MEKNLKGKECSKGIYQRKDGLYSARYYDKNGKRKEKYFETLPETKNWLADARYEERHSLIVTSPDMTVDKWFTYWIKSIVCDLAPNTTRNYQERYKQNIQPVIGAMCIADVKPMHCKAVLNRMEATYAGSTIRQTYITMGTMLKSAVMNDIIAKHPMNGVRYTKPVRAVDDIKYLTVGEQEQFLETAKRSHNYRQYALLLETGLRTAEMIGLTWDSIDWKKCTLTVSKSLEYRHSQGYWRAGPPKTKKSYRTMPLTEKAYAILKSCYDERSSRKEAEILSQVLEYIDSRTGENKCLVMRDLVFVNWRTGEPAKNSSYDTHLYKLCDEAGIKRFCMHALRHTYATRAIERGVQPKVLQQLLGHASIKTTMDRYVHVTDESLVNAIRQFQQATPPATKKGRTRNLTKGENPDKSRVFGQVKDKMKLGIVGLPNVGKSTLFNSLTKAGAESANYPFCTIDPNVGVVAVPDRRLKLLGDLYHSRKVTPAVIEFVDIAGLVKGASKGEGLGNQFLANIREVDAIVHVVRCFEDPNVIHVEGSVDPMRDIETINLELIFSDIEILERRIAKTAKSANNDKSLAKELVILKELKAILEEGKLACTYESDDEDVMAFVNSLTLLTCKPVIFAANVSEDDLTDDGASNSHVAAVRAFAAENGSEVFVISAQIEQEIAELDDDEKQEYLEALGLTESGLDKLIAASYRLLGLISYLTSGEDETRAWTIRVGTKAPQAAGKIHTDFERGFIRAEVVNYQDLLDCGTYAKAKEKGLVGLEGKEYVVKDGDVILFRFNV